MTTSKLSNEIMTLIDCHHSGQSEIEVTIPGKTFTTFACLLRWTSYYLEGNEDETGETSVGTGYAEFTIENSKIIVSSDGLPDYELPSQNDAEIEAELYLLSKV